MTILTKPSSEKKGDKLVVPLVDNDQLAASAPPSAPGTDPEAQTHNIVILRTRTKRVSTTVTLCLLLTALLVVGIGIVAGFHLYNQYVRAQLQKFRGTASIPYANMLYDDGWNDPHSFREEFELDTDEGNYEKITVPDFKDGRTGRFVHDFNMNITGIIDLTGKNCFVMPLDRSKVLPPKTLYDLVTKMWDGYYKVNTEVIRESMHVITPPIEDTSSIGEYIAEECRGRRIYKLEKYVGGVVKRSANPDDELVFTQYAGKGITQFRIVNAAELEQYERENLVR